LGNFRPHGSNVAQLFLEISLLFVAVIFIAMVPQVQELDMEN
jgi:hypothetical protein